MNFDYRRLYPDDWQDWQALRLEGARDFPMGFLVTPDEVEADPAEACRRILSFGNSRGVFAKSRLVGFCSYRPLKPLQIRHRAEIGPFFVSRSFQGSGAAQVLMTSVIREARASNEVEQLELFVDTENHRAIGFYEKNGFERIATHPDGVRIGGRSRDDHFYVLRLQKPEKA
ncbi:ribosomal protein S18 acetylase RimI-like enzyme [Roseibium hamelinense]|uniref:Ribosomal protein S18 acetylase RimI-like enzyme n=1 Tax=Roseibium hamelinense TaxID=150831 RepID=A0A562SFC2_9HYPH|nr:GNAT family N-acetyltransferase [Roseibium hamelinense]MTI44147.1 GNAT family N-acetyltransferase [Roseibium hamelinense]TWI80071.1 ribosomal protein S18 acetylase RimI-like enzyme [Roseibium hamelinense]